MAFPDILRILATPPSLRWRQRRTAPESLGPDLVIGASSGALDAVMFASHRSPGGIGRPAAAWLPAGRAGAC